MNSDRLDVDVIEARIDTKVVVYNSTASTNDIAWRYATQHKYNGLAVFAESQSKGRGRQGNKWLSNDGQSILGSILLLDCPCGLETVTLAIPIAVVKTLEDIGLGGAKIKWPNDILVNGKKICGVLIESRKGNSQNNYVIGIGINCHQQKKFFENIALAMPGTSIDIETGTPVIRNELAAAMISNVKEWIEKAGRDKKYIAQCWQQLSNQIGQRVHLQFKGEDFHGHCIGVDPVEGLILQLDRGSVRMFEAAHTTIIKQKSY